MSFRVAMVGSARGRDKVDVLVMDVEEDAQL